MYAKTTILSEKALKDRLYANQKARMRKLIHGDKVLIFLPGKTNYLYHLFEKVITNVDYLININNKMKNLHYKHAE